MNDSAFYSTFNRDTISLTPNIECVNTLTGINTYQLTVYFDNYFYSIVQN